MRASNLARRVTFLDYVPLADLPSLYAGADLAVYPSLYEGFGFPALEAQACATPLVCSNASSLLRLPVTARYFDPRSTAEIRRAIEFVLTDETLRQNLVERGTANVKR